MATNAILNSGLTPLCLVIASTWILFGNAEKREDYITILGALSTSKVTIYWETSEACDISVILFSEYVNKTTR